MHPVAGGPWHFLPVQGGARANGAFDRDIGRRRGRPCHCGQRDRVQPGELGGVFEIHVLDHVAVGDAVFDANVLMLVVVVFVGLHYSHRGETRFVEAPVIAAAAKAVNPVDHHGVEIGDVAVRHFVDVAGDVARRRIDLAALQTALVRFPFGFQIARAFGKNPGGGVVDDAIDAGNIADHVVVEHGVEIPAAVDGVLRENPGAVQALFLAGKTGQGNSGRESIPAQHPRRLDDAGHARGVVVRARRVGLEIHRVADPGIQMGGHHHHPVRFALAP